MKQAASDSKDLDACGKLIAAASYLYAGGVDLYTSDALKPAPVLALSIGTDVPDPGADPNASGNDPNM